MEKSEANCNKMPYARLDNQHGTLSVHIVVSPFEKSNSARPATVSETQKYDHKYLKQDKNRYNLENSRITRVKIQRHMRKRDETDKPLSIFSSFSLSLFLSLSLSIYIYIYIYWNHTVKKLLKYSELLRFFW